MRAPVLTDTGRALGRALVGRPPTRACNTDATPQATPGLMLMGGSTDVNAGFRWFNGNTNGGDVVVLRCVQLKTTRVGAPGRGSQSACACACPVGRWGVLDSVRPALTGTTTTFTISAASRRSRRS